MTKTMKNKLFISSILITFSPWAHAAEVLPWKTFLFVVMVISLVAGTIMSIRNKQADNHVSKVILAGVYFWVFTFAQLIILALIYHFTN